MVKFLFHNRVRFKFSFYRPPVSNTDDKVLGL